MNAFDDFETRFTKALAKTPEMPDCYREIVRRIRRKVAVFRAAWGIAAMLAISLTSFLFMNNAAWTIPSDVAEEIQGLSSHLAGDDIQEELVSCSLIGEDIDN
jgi:hypothetical protein